MKQKNSPSQSHDLLTNKECVVPSNNDKTAKDTQPTEEDLKKEILKTIKEKFNGSVRNYLLSLGEFKEVDEYKEGFQAGQLAERERCLKIIDEILNRKFITNQGSEVVSTYTIKELTQKIKEEKVGEK